ncbi:hypothetical protein [Nocardioides humi]|uniref:Uncharacterized protein n=1 Tax=Nocardioides humi TaxID=449461 RepID=A0ABN2B1L4_9ACTN|nr:hypothetical protein [Nocardioides humi]
MKDLRRIVVTVVIASFSVAALLGIIALLGPGDFGDTGAKVLLTTVIVGVESTVALCLLSLAGHRWAPLAAAGGLASIVATAAAVTLTWGDFGWDSAVDELLWKSFGVGAILAATAAQLSLLIALVLRPGRAAGPLGGLLAATGLVAAIVAAMAIGPILLETDPGGGYWRAFGVLAILDVLGSVVLIALGAFGRVRTRVTEPPGGSVGLTADQQQRVLAWAATHGTSPDRVVAAALDAYLS